jgi:hypothetical protein
MPGTRTPFALVVDFFTPVFYGRILLKGLLASAVDYNDRFFPTSLYLLYYLKIQI